MKKQYVSGTTAQATGGQKKAGNVTSKVCRPSGNVCPHAPIVGSKQVHAAGVRAGRNKRTPRKDTARKVTETHPRITINEPEVFAKLQEAARIAGTAAHVMAIMSIEYMMTQLEQGKVTILHCGNQGQATTMTGGAAA